MQRWPLSVRLAVAGSGLLGVLFLIADSTTVPVATAQEAADGPAAKAPSLPAAPNRVGRIRRDKDGNIVPDGPPLPPDENATQPKPPEVFPGPAYLTPPPSVPGGQQPYDTSYLQSLQDRQVQARRAHRRQAEIDRIVREEAVERRDPAPGGAYAPTPREATLMRELERRDGEIRQREMRRYELAQPYAAHPEFWFVTGPRGKQYVATGMTRLDAEMVAGSPAATMDKLVTLRRAVLSTPGASPEDHLVVQELERLILVLRQRL